MFRHLAIATQISAFSRGSSGGNRLPFDEENEILIKSSESFERTLDLANSEAFHWKFEAPCAETYQLQFCITAPENGFIGDAALRKKFKFDLV